MAFVVVRVAPEMVTRENEKLLIAHSLFAYVLPNASNHAQAILSFREQVAVEQIASVDDISDVWRLIVVDVLGGLSASGALRHEFSPIARAAVVVGDATLAWTFTLDLLHSKAVETAKIDGRTRTESAACLGRRVDDADEQIGFSDVHDLIFRFLDVCEIRNNLGDGRVELVEPLGRSVQIIVACNFLHELSLHEYVVRHVRLLVSDVFRLSMVVAAHL